MTYKSIIIGSAPRTGGMWTFNIVREIFFQLSKKIIPLDVPQDDQEMLKYHIINLARNDDQISIIKIHQKIKKEYTKKTKILINIRDPRDAVVSYKRFMKFENFNFSQAIKFIQNSIDLVLYYRKNFNKENLLEISYKDIINKPENIFLSLEKFLEIKLNNKIINEILEKFSKNKISKMIDDKEQFIKKMIKNKKTVSEKNLVTLGPKNVRFFDEKTGFQTGHVSNYKEGEWKKHFSKDEILSINKKFEKWLTSNNFSI